MYTTPLPIIRQLVLTIIVGISCFFIGIIYHTRTDDALFLILSICILFSSVIKSYNLFFTIKNHAYVVIKGTCKSMTRLLIQNCNKFVLEDTNGNRQELLLGKNIV